MNLIGIILQPLTAKPPTKQEATEQNTEEPLSHAEDNTQTQGQATPQKEQATRIIPDESISNGHTHRGTGQQGAVETK